VRNSQIVHFRVSSSTSSSGYLDSKLILFRALGRILNSKRLDEMETRKYHSFELPPELRRKTLEYKVPEDQCLASGFLPSSFSQFLHQNSIPFVSDINTYASFMNDFSLGDHFSRFYGYGNNKMKEYESAFSCRSMSFWNDKPNKPGFLALHRPAMIDNRKKMEEHAMRTSIQKFTNFNGNYT